MFFLKESNLKNLNSYLSLYKRNFEGHHFSIQYLDWLYNKNPTKKFYGIDITLKNKVIGQCGGIPTEFSYKNKIIKSIICVNVCLDKKYRKRGLIEIAQKKLILMLKKKKFDLVFTIANFSAKNSWLKSVQAKILNPLEVKIFFLTKNTIKNNKKFKNTMHTIWPLKKLNWRIQSSRNRFKVINLDDLICLENKINILSAISPINHNASKIKKNSSFNLMPKLFIGFGFDRIFNSLSLNLPLFLRPSPLLFIYKILDTSKLKDKNLKDIYFSLADFDVY